MWEVWTWPVEQSTCGISSLQCSILGSNPTNTLLLHVILISLMLSSHNKGIKKPQHIFENEYNLNSRSTCEFYLEQTQGKLVFQSSKHLNKLCSELAAWWFCWWLNKGGSAGSTGGPMRPLELRWKTNLTMALSGKLQRSEGLCPPPSVMFGGVKVWLCRSNSCFPLSSSGRVHSVCYNRKRLKVKAQIYCLPVGVTDACLSYFTMSV